MAFGLVVNGDSNSLLFSTETDNLVFVGKATYSTVYTTAYTGEYQVYFGTTIYNRPWACLYEFTITLNSSVSAIMPFVWNPYGWRIGVINTYKVDSNTWRTLVASSTPSTGGSGNAPTIYVFARYYGSTLNYGNGINVFDSSGSVAFSTNTKPLLLKSIYSGSVGYSNLQAQSSGSMQYVGNSGSNTISSFSYAPIGGQKSITKPAIFFPSNQTAVGYNNVYFIFEYLAKYNTSNGNLVAEWSNVNQTFGSLSSSQSSSNIVNAMVIDGANYD